MGTLAQNLKQQIQVMIKTRMITQHTILNGYFHDADISPAIFQSKMNQVDIILEKIYKVQVHHQFWIKYTFYRPVNFQEMKT